MPFQKILVGVDGSEASKKAARVAAQLAKRAGAELILLHVADDVEPQDDIPSYGIYRERRQYADRVLEVARQEVASEGVSCQVRAALGPVADQIVGVAQRESCDVICVGTRGMTGLKRVLLGSVADRVIRHAHCPVVVVR